MTEAASAMNTEAKDANEAGPAAAGAAHKLKDSWSLWYDEGHSSNPQRGAPMNEDEWMASMKKVCTFDTVEDFWAVFNNLIPASKMSIGSSFFLFKTGITPEWEDVENKDGGRWHFTLTKVERMASDGGWLYLAMALVGNLVDVAADVSGGTVAMREREFRVSLWTKNRCNLSEQHDIGKNLKAVMKMADDRKLYFRLHEEDKKRSKTNLLTI